MFKTYYLPVQEGGMPPGALEVLPFRLDSDGYLRCGECQNSMWCPHMERLIKDRGDTDTIWGEPAEKPIEVQFVQVPIVPTAAQYAKCHLELIEKLHAYKVELVSLLNPGELVFLGFIHPPEARGTLRLMIVDWFRGSYDTQMMECKSTSHSFAAQLRWKKDIADPRTAFAQTWSVFTTGRCLMCAGAMGDMDDLIPDDERASIW